MTGKHTYGGPEHDFSNEGIDVDYKSSEEKWDEINSGIADAGLVPADFRKEDAWMVDAFGGDSFSTNSTFPPESDMKPGVLVNLLVGLMSAETLDRKRFDRKFQQIREQSKLEPKDIMALLSILKEEGLDTLEKVLAQGEKVIPTRAQIRINVEEILSKRAQ